LIKFNEHAVVDGLIMDSCNKRTDIKPEAGKWWLDREFAVFKFGGLVKRGDTFFLLKSRQ